MRRTSPQPSPLLLLLAFISTASSFHLFLGGNAPQLVGRTSPSSVLLDTPPHLFCGCSRIVDSRDLHAVFPDEGAGDFTLFCTHRGITSDFGYQKPDRLNKPDPFGTRARFKTKSRYSPPSGDDVLLHILVPDFATPGLDWGLGRLPRIIEGTWTIPWDGTPARDDSSEGDATPKASLVDQLGCERCPDGFDGRRGHRRSGGGTAAAGLAVGAGLKMREVLVSVPRGAMDDVSTSVTNGVLGGSWRSLSSSSTSSPASSRSPSPISSASAAFLPELLRVRRLPRTAHLVLPEAARRAREAIPAQTTVWWHPSPSGKDRDGPAVRLERLLHADSTTPRSSSREETGETEIESERYDDDDDDDDKVKSRDGYWVDCGAGEAVSAADATAARRSLTLPEGARWVASLSALDTGLPALPPLVSAATATATATTATTTKPSPRAAAPGSPPGGGGGGGGGLPLSADARRPREEHPLWTLSEESIKALRRDEGCAGMACF